jgi:hypothetical protein
VLRRIKIKKYGKWFYVELLGLSHIRFKTVRILKDYLKENYNHRSNFENAKTRKELV